MKSMSIIARMLWGLLAALLLMSFTIEALAQTKRDLSDASLEDLLDIRVSSVTRTERTLSQTASSVFVITAEDIRRSGATNIAEILRIVPGLDVARINANTWAISARGFNGRFANELLVMVDGRPIYTATFGGVFWDVLDLPLEDIDRIEVIRGPGASAWGANAVNGVISILTRKSSETQGGIVSALAGTSEQSVGTVQYGSRIGKNLTYRVHAKYRNQFRLPGLDSATGADDWHLLTSGFRMDRDFAARDKLTLEGDLYGGNEGGPAPVLQSVTAAAPVDMNLRVPLSGGFLQATWNHRHSDRSDLQAQLSFTRYKRLDILAEDRNTVNLGFQHHLAWGGRQDLVWGATYRFSESATHGNLQFSLDPPDSQTNLASLFFQDEVSLEPDRLSVTFGTKLEHDTYGGWNLMPSVRAAWNPTPDRTLWAAVSHAVRTPSEVDVASRSNFAGFSLPDGSPALSALLGNPHFDAEALTAYELGYRADLLPHWSVDLATYYNHYTSQQSTEPAPAFFEPSPQPPHLVIPITYRNLGYGESHGVEISSNWKIADRWTLSPGYAFERIHMHGKPGSHDTATPRENEGSSPVHAAQLRSSLRVRKGLTWDAAAYFVDRLSSPAVSSYTRLDSQLAWQCKENFSLALVGQNLLRDRHLEFLDQTGSVDSTTVRRSAYLKLTWTF